MKIIKVFVVLCFILISFLAFNSFDRPKDKRIKIQFASWGSQSEVSILKPILADFEKENPNIKVEFVHIPQNYFQKIHLLFASKMAPDVVFLNNYYLPFFAKAGVLQEISTNDGFNLDLFYPKTLESMSFEGKLYGIPRDVSNMVVYFNKDLFRKYNVEFPDKNWDFDDFLTIAQSLTKDTNSDGKTDIWGVSFDESPALFYLPYLMSEGGGILSDDTKSVIIDSVESKKGLNFYSDLSNKYHVAPTAAQSASATMAQLFLQEKLAMQVSGRWLVPKYSTDANFNWGVITFPKGEVGSVVPLDSSGWTITKNSKHKEEALKLINFLSSKKSIETFSKSGLIVPARIDVAEGEFLKIKNSPCDNRVFVNAIYSSKPTPVSINYSEIQDEIQEKLKYIFNK